MIALLLALVFVVPLPAYAAREIVAGFEGGLTNGLTNTFDVSSGTPTVVHTGTVPTNGDSGNHFQLQINPGSGSAEYLGKSGLTSSAEWTCHMGFMCNSFPSVERSFFEFAASGGSAEQCFLTIGPDGKVKLYFGDTGNECVQATNNGTECSTVADCTENNPNEATCDNSKFAQSSTLTTGQHVELAITNDTSQTDPGNVRCGLWQDGTNRGTKTKPQGKCNAGDLNEFDACAKNADCDDVALNDGLGTCNVTTVANVTRVHLGATETEASAMECYVDSVVCEPAIDTTTLPTLRLFDMHPTSEIGIGACTQTGCFGSGLHYQCVDDSVSGGTPDDDTTKLLCEEGEIEEYGLADASLGAGESIYANAGAGVNCVVAEFNDNGDTGKDIRLQMVQTTQSLSGPDFDVAACGETYCMAPTAVFSTEPDGTTWDGLSDVNNLQLRTNHTGTAGLAYRWDVTSCFLEMEITKPLPVLPDEVSDWNDDGVKTFAYIGDSRWDDAALEAAITERLTEFHNIIECANGGDRIGDLSTDWQAILDGTSTLCNVLKGDAAPADLAIFEAGVNDSAGHPLPPEEGACWQSWCVNGSNDGDGCAVDADCPGGSCGGPEHGLPCSIPGGYYTITSPPTTYCTRGPDFLAKTMHVPPTPCSFGVACSGDPQIGHAGDCDILSPNVGFWCSPGSHNSPACPGGFCTQRTSLNYVEKTFHEMIQAAQARFGTEKVQVILALPYETTRQTITAGVNCYFSKSAGFLAHQRAQMITMAAQYGVDWIDIQAEFARACPSNDIAKCRRDTVHLSTAPTPGSTPSTFGDEVLATLIEACVENNGTFVHQHCTHIKATPTPTPTPP